ncbi:recombinase family protein [Dechloromonas sp. A34]|uniref:recombinase family protein n=1 Tax=Dechloromonas sp. A34 TaxID=447588 RepID=UPI002248D1F0|nr:recombinase family protein [Dechloromonas sp. A34]
MTTKAYSYIRFSTPEQMKGDSLRRQLEKSQLYAAEHGLELDTTLNMRDLGVSAFRKANVEKGNLGAFIQAIEKGIVKPGSHLLVESLDRLSRAEVADALRIFLNIIEHEIVIVTLADNRVYSKDSINKNSVELIISIAIMMRSHDESLTKSVRRQASWKQAKKLAAESGKKITRKVPFWLSLPDKNGEFVVKPDEVEVVRQIFEWAKSGLGYLLISKRLNERGIKSPAGSTYSTERVERGWGTSSVAYVINSEAVIGNLVVDKKAVEPTVIKGYYPAIIDESLFYAARPRPKQSKGGRASPAKTNLFTHLLHCGYCRGLMQVDAGKVNGVRRSNMVCQNGRRGFGCLAKPWHYEQFEESFLTFVREVEVSTLVGRKNGNVRLRDDVDGVRGRITDNDARTKAITSAIEEGGALSPLVMRLKELEAERLELEIELKVKSLELDDYLHSESRLNQSIEQIKVLYAQIKAEECEDRVILRYAIADHIASIVDSIEVFSAGTMLAPFEANADLGIYPDPVRSFTVKFRNGMLRLVQPDGEWTIKL